MSNRVLEVELPGQPSYEIPARPDPLAIGRGAGNDLTLDHLSISGHHARIRLLENRLGVTDLGSANGTFLGWTRLPANRERFVGAGRWVRLGQVRLRLKPTSAERRRSFAILGAGIAAGAVGLLLLCAVGLLAVRGLAYLNGLRKPQVAGCSAPAMTVIQRGGTFLEPVSLGSTMSAPFPASAATQPPTGPGTPTLTPFPTWTVGPTLTPGPTQPPSRPIESIAFLELPFPYDGGNINYGGSVANFMEASQMRFLGGRVNSFFDHDLPIYPSEIGGREPDEPPTGAHVLMYDGSLYPNNNLNYSGHPAYDFSTFDRGQPTTPLFAAADGRIDFVGESYGGALTIKIVHAVPDVGTFMTIYMHLHPDEHYEAMLGREGQLITAGTRIGTMGNTGFSTGHHLHFEVRYDRNQDGLHSNNEVVDPYGWYANAAYPNDPWVLRSAPISNYLWIHPLGVVAQVHEDGSGALAPVAEENGTGGGFDSTICAAPGSLPPGGQVSWSWAPDPPPGDGLHGTGNACMISVFDAQGNPVTKFDPPLRISVPFSEEELSNFDPASLAIHLLEPGTTEWIKLSTELDQETQVASALIDRPGKCALLGRLLEDLTPPMTEIMFTGRTAANGSWYEDVIVTLSSTDISGIASTEYSLDGGSTWMKYDGPFELQPNGLPPVLDRIEGEQFAFGPGRFVILAVSTDGVGNVEEPPAFRVLIIDPALAPGDAAVAAAQTTTPSPTTMPTVTVTATPTPSRSPTEAAPACASEVVLDQNANCRSGPGTNYSVLTSFSVGEVLGLAGQSTADWPVKWWFVEIPDSLSHCWLSGSLVTVAGDTSESCVQAISAPPTVTPTPTSSPTFTPQPQGAGAPPAPVSLNPGNQADLSCSGSVSLTWSAVSDPDGIIAYQWEIQVSSSGFGGPWSSVQSGSSTQTSVQVAGLNCLWYRWRVRAIDGIEAAGPYSSWAAFVRSIG